MGRGTVRYGFAVLVLASVGLLSACGGGGGGGGSAYTPPVPLTYSGDTAPAAASAANVQAFGPGTLAGVNDMRGLVAGVPTQAVRGHYDRTEAGPAGGSVRVVGTIAKDGTGSLRETYAAYASTVSGGATITLDGTVLIDYETPAATRPTKLGFTFQNLAVTEPASAITFTGTIEEILTPDSVTGFQDTALEGDLLLSDRASGSQVWLHPLDAVQVPPGSATVASAEVPRTVSGRVYVSSQGYMDVGSVRPLLYYQDGEIPSAGGPLVLTSTGPAIDVRPLNATYSLVGLDRSGDGRIDAGNLFDWSRLGYRVDQDLAPGPVADVHTAVDSTADLPPFHLDAAFSRERGDGLLSYHWTLVLAPPGSTAVVQHAEEARAELDPDVAGNYLVRLTVSDAAGDVDAQAVRMTALNGGSSGATGFVDAGPDETAAVGQQIVLGDSMSSLPDGFPVGQPTWTLHPPPGSQATLQHPDSPAPTFTPDVPGIYRVSVSTAAGGATRLVSVDTPPHFDFVPFSTGPILPLGVDLFHVGDLNGDGRPDIVMTDPYSEIFVAYNRGGGHFSAPAELTATLPSGIAIGDLNGDGRNDLALTQNRLGTAKVFFQGPGGTLDSGRIWHCASCYFDMGSHPSIAHLFGQSWNSLWTNGGASAALELGFDLDGNGQSTPQYGFNFAGSANMTIGDYELGDLDGDGIEDLLFSAQDLTGGPYQLAVSLGQSGRTFAAPAFYPALTGPRALLDLNGDGRDDVLIYHPTGTPQLEVHYANPDGSLSAGVDYPLGPLNPFMRNNRFWTARLPGIAHRVPVTGVSAYTGRFTESYLTWFGVLPDGSLGAQSFYPLASASPELAADMESADIDGDGRPDLVMGDGSSNLDVLFGSPWPARAASPGSTAGPRAASRSGSLLSLEAAIGIGRGHDLLARP